MHCRPLGPGSAGRQTGWIFQLGVLSPFHAEWQNHSVGSTQPALVAAQLTTNACVGAPNETSGLAAGVGTLEGRSRACWCVWPCPLNPGGTLGAYHGLCVRRPAEQASVGLGASTKGGYMGQRLVGRFSLKNQPPPSHPASRASRPVGQVPSSLTFEC